MVMTGKDSVTVHVIIIHQPGTMYTVFRRRSVTFSGSIVTPGDNIEAFPIPNICQIGGKIKGAEAPFNYICSDNQSFHLPG